MKYLLLPLLFSVMFCLRAIRADEADVRGGRRITVAVIPFHQASAKETYGPLAEAAGDLLAARLEAVEGLVLVDRAAIDKALREQKLAQAASDAERAQLGKIVGARYVLAGSVVPIGETFQVNAHLLDVETARVVRSAQAAARGDQLLEPIDKLARELAGDLNLKLPELTPQQIDKSPEANLHFMRGLGYYYAKMPDDAVVEFMKVLAIDPSHARARFWNGMAYFDQAEYGHAKLEFDRFLKQSGEHELAARAKELAANCEAQLRKPHKGESP
jgi:TolB-like protein